MSSFRSRLQWGVVVLVGALVGGTGSTSYVLLSRSLEQSLDETLLNLAQTELASQIDTGEVHVHEPAPGLLRVMGGTGYEKVAWVTDRNGVVRAHTSNLNLKEPRAVNEVAARKAWNGIPTVGTMQLGQLESRAIYYRLQDPESGDFMLGTVAIPMAPIRRVEEQVRDILLGIAFASLGLAGVAAGVFSRRISRPLESLASQAHKLRVASHAEPIELGPSDNEFLDLAGAMNAATENLRLAIADRDDVIVRQRQFMADASHELRTPLANVLGTSEVALRKDRPAGELKEALETVVRESTRMTQLVADLMLLARLDAGVRDLDIQPCDLAHLARESVAAHGAEADRMGIRIVLDAVDLPICGDRLRLRQALDNLLSNALRYAASTVSVRVFLEGDQAVFEIQNDGTSIPPEAVPHLFERFYRVGHDRSRESGGSGLGLAIVRSIVEGHGGSVSASPEPATFALRFPVEYSDKQAQSYTA